ncbi:MAG TPA: hypothetical protein VEY70_01495 [Metabacillus sp.]|nr:hypothetical protein [Metabacillus sp.]
MDIDRLKMLERDNEWLRNELLKARNKCVDMAIEIEEYKNAHQQFLKEYEHEYGWQKNNEKGGGQWHKGATAGFEHVKRIFDKHFNFQTKS